MEGPLYRDPSLSFPFRVFAGEIGAQQIAAFASPYLAQLLAIECEGEAGVFLVHLDIDQTPGGRRFGARAGAASSQVLSAAQLLSGDSNRLKLEVGQFLSAVRSA